MDAAAMNASINVAPLQQRNFPCNLFQSIYNYRISSLTLKLKLWSGVPFVVVSTFILGILEKYFLFNFDFIINFLTYANVNKYRFSIIRISNILAKQHVLYPLCFSATWRHPRNFCIYHATSSLFSESRCLVKRCICPKNIHRSKYVVAAIRMCYLLIYRLFA